MRLTSIEIKGFKSFADKTIVNFENNITGVVGPNGCGKSNIVDAIRWVLGEQKAKTLRLEKMDNIIFNGTKDRKQGGLAEVSLTLDNTKNLIPTEFSSVTITRVIYRSGDSEYKINGVTCRLKDIRNLFLDTGISTSTYAIIELKMVDDILNDVENSRRRLLEQAAGISKYKTRKKETLSKLNSTEADLDRVDDLLFEIEGNLKSLESQARKAKRYKALKEDYKIQSLDLAKFDVVKINEQFEEIKKSKKEKEDKKLGIETAQKSLEAKLQKDKTGLIEKEKHLSSQQKELNEVISQIQQLESDKRLQNQRKHFLKEKIENLKSTILNSSDSIKSLQTEIQELAKKKALKYSSIDAKKQELETLKSKVEKIKNDNLSKKDFLNEEQNKLQIIVNEVYNLEKELASKQASYESLKETTQRSLFEKEERLNDLQALDKEVITIQKDFEKQDNLLNGLIEKDEKNAKKLEHLEQQIESTRQDLSNQNRILDAKNNEYRLTKNMIDNLEGFPESIKFLKKSAFWLKEAPLLTDIIYCDEKYRVAIESVLNPFLNHYIIKDEDSAFRSLDLLSESAKGKAGFFVLDYFKKGQPAITKEIKGLKRAIDIVEINKDYKHLLSYLLQGIYLVENEEALKSFKGDKTFEGHIITENGNIFKSKYEVHGGAVGLFEGKRVGRKKNLEKLEKDIKSAEKKVLSIKKQLESKQEELNTLRRDNLKSTIDRERIVLQEFEKQLVFKKSKIDNFKELVNKIIDRNSEAQKIIEGANASIQKLNKELEEKRKIQLGLKEKISQFDNDFSSATEIYNAVFDEYNQNNILYVREENELKTITQLHEFNEHKLVDTNQLMEQNKKELENSIKEIDSIVNDEGTIEAKLKTLYETSSSKKEKLGTSESDYFEWREQIDVVENQIRDKGRELDMILRQIIEYKDQLNELRMELTTLKQRFSIEFKIDIEKVLASTELPDININQLKEKVEKIKKRLENFGEVNPMAEEAYNEMKKRHDFITEQKEDLLNAKENLLTTIKEIEDTAKEHFMETFTSVRTNFIKVFRSMFTEDDSCDLILVDPEQPLDSKIKITAKPKGKRPQSINQLSGGEKTLTSLSLLFALYLHKPAPFCILDEVDAPLDDANIGKFNKAIRSFSDNSQFIIVTHNKQTMAAVDAIYGVTMAKKGISQVVPVSFKDLN